MLSPSIENISFFAKKPSTDRLITYANWCVVEVFQLSIIKDSFFFNPCSICLGRRFDPTIFNIYEIVRGGDIGDIHSIKTCSRDPEYPSPDYIKKSGKVVLSACKAINFCKENPFLTVMMEMESFPFKFPLILAVLRRMFELL